MRVPGGRGRFGTLRSGRTRFRQLLLSDVPGPPPAAQSRRSSVAASDPGLSTVVSILSEPPPPLEPGVDIPGRPVDPGSLIGPPLRSGYIQGQPRPVLPGAPSAYPIVVPEPRRLFPVLNKTFTTGLMSMNGTVTVIQSLNDSINRSLTSVSGGRTSDTTRCLGFRIRAFAHPSTPFSGPVYALYYTWLLIYDKQPEAAIPSVDDIFDADPSSTLVNSNSLQKFGTRDRYRILWKHTGTIMPSGTSTGLPVVSNGHYSVVMKSINCNLPVNYGRTTGTGPGQMSLGNIYFVALGPPRPMPSFAWKSMVFRFDCDYLYRDQ